MTDSNPLPDFDSMWDYDKPAETEKRFRETLASAPAGSAYRLELLTQIARTLGLQRKFEEAHRMLDEVENGLPPGVSRPRIRYLLERGRVFNSSRRPAEARPLFLEAWESGLKAKEDFHAVDAAHMMAIVEPTEKQTAWNMMAIELAEKSSEPRARKWLGSLYNNTGWTYHDQKEYEKALAIFTKALAFRETQREAQPIRIAKWCIARTYRSLGRLDEALKIQEALLKEYESAGTTGPYVFEELGELLLMKHRNAEAVRYFALAYAELSKDPWFVEREPARLQRLKEQGHVSQ